MGELAVFVDSYDKNKDLWENVFSVMEYFWKDCCFNKYLVTNSINYTKHGVTSITVGSETDWLLCTLEGLRQIKEKYIFFMFEDYYFSKEVYNKQFEAIIQRMDKEDVFFYRLSPINGLDRSQSAVYISDTFPYAVNLQPAIWNRERLIGWLEEMQQNGISTPWQFEFFFIDKMNRGELSSEKGKVKGVLYDTRDLMGYQNAIIQGKWVRGVMRKYRKFPGLRLSTGNRPFMSVKDEAWNSVKQFGHLVISYQRREKIKKLLKKGNIKFMR